MHFNNYKSLLFKSVRFKSLLSIAPSIVPSVAFPLVLMTVLTAFFAIGALNAHFKTDNWLEKNHPRQLDLNKFKHTFTNSTANLAILIDLEKKTLLSDNVLPSLSALTADLERLDFIKKVQTPLNTRIFSNSKSNIEFLSFQQMFDADNKYSLEDYRKDLTNSVYFRKIVSESFDSFLIVLDIDEDILKKHILNKENGKPSSGLDKGYLKGYTDSIIKIDNEHTEAVNQLDKLLSGYPAFKRYYYYGNDYIDNEINLNSADSVSVIIIFTLVFIAFMVLVIYQRFSYVVIVIYTIVNTLLYTFALFSWLDYNITAVSTILLSLILVIAFSDSLYILNVWRSERGGKTRQQTLKKTANFTWKPCLITSVTTSIGFGSFYFSAMLPFKQLGIISVISIMGSYIIIMITTLLFLYLCDSKTIIENKRHYTLASPISALTNRLVGVCCRYSSKVIVCIIGGHLAIAALLINNTLNVDANTADQLLDSQSNAYAGFNKVNNKFYAHNTIEIIYDSQQDDHFKQIDNFNSLISIGNEIDSWDYVANIESYIDIIAMLHKKVSNDGAYPVTQQQLSQELLFIEFMSSGEVNDLLQPYIDFNYSSTRFHIKLNRTLSRAELQQLLERIRKVSADNISITPLITGGKIYDYHLSSEVIDTQFGSVFTVVLATSILFITLFGLTLGVIGCLANTLPFLALLGAIGHLKIDFDFAAILAFSINFGVMIDMSIHILDKFTKQTGNRKLTELNEENIRTIVNFIGKPVIYILVAMLVCYLLFLNSDIYLLQKFGALSIPIVFSAVLVNLVLIPAILLLVNRFISRRKIRNTVTYSNWRLSINAFRPLFLRRRTTVRDKRGIV